MIDNNNNENYTLKQYMEKIIEKPLEIFKILTSWSDKDKQEFSYLLSELQRPFDKKSESTKSKGDRLENLVAFIIKKSFFFEIYRNVRTPTNEIDQVIVFSDKGRQALDKFGISRDIIGIDEDVILGECKNYESNLNVTYVGKFYSLLVATDISLGIIFTKEGLTGEESEYRDAYGLIKVLRIIEKYKNERDLYIIDFTIDDYINLLEGVNFFDIIKAKKLLLKTAGNYNEYLKDNTHENETVLKDIVSKI